MSNSEQKRLQYEQRCAARGEVPAHEVDRVHTVGPDSYCIRCQFLLPGYEPGTRVSRAKKSGLHGTWRTGRTAPKCASGVAA